MPTMTTDTVLADLQPIFQEVLDQPGLKIARQSSALNTPGWDSLAHISLIESVEDHFRVRFALGELEELKEVGDLVDLILTKANKK